MWRDDAYLLDMLLAARKIVKYSQVLDYERFIKDEMVQDAVMRQIQVIGEAARKISQEFKKAHPDISWPGIIGMRHRVIHEISGWFRRRSGKRRFKIFLI
jgi:uncharacterized protein with HEPN domain